MDFKRLSGIIGMLAPVVMLSFVILAVSLMPGFSWTDDDLSSLAGSEGDRPIWTATGAPAITFNVGLVVTGTMLLVFALGLLESRDVRRTSSGRLGTSLFPLTGISMFLVGVIPAPVGPLHVLVSYILFLVNPVPMVLMGIGYRKRDNNLYAVTVVLGLLALIPFFMPLPISGMAIRELAAILPSSVFLVIFGYRLLRESFRKMDHGTDEFSDGSEE